MTLVHTAAQGTLLEVLPQGVWLFRGLASRAEQEQMRDELRGVARAAPFVTPEMPGGVPFNLRLTNAGTWGWCGSRGHFFYSKTQREGAHRGRQWPQIPLKVMELSRRGALEAGCDSFNPTACLVNYYDTSGSLGLHRDDTEGEDFNQPVVTIGLGDDGIIDVGGLSREDRVQSFEMKSGDVMVLWMIGRLYYHRVKRIVAGTSNLLARGGRISATLRTVRR